MRIALIGGAGQLGADIRNIATDVIPFDLPEFDATNREAVRRMLSAAEPDAVVNCAALTNVDQCEREPETAARVNALSALYVAEAAAALNARLLFISTDYVFGADGERNRPYNEDDAVGPVNVYGATKLAGEALSRVGHPGCCIVRSSGLYGLAGARGKGGNFVETMLRLAAEGQTIRVVNDQRLCPTSTAALAPVLLQLLETKAVGVRHVAAPDSCSWCEFAAAIFELAEIAVDLRPIPSSEYPLPAKRPGYCAMTSTRLKTDGVTGCPPWREMLFAYLKTRM